ncbi:MAG: YlxP-like protein, partial [uncultured Thermomicrobiales bacterium]
GDHHRRGPRHPLPRGQLFVEGQAPGRPLDHPARAQPVQRRHRRGGGFGRPARRDLGRGLRQQQRPPRRRDARHRGRLHRAAGRDGRTGGRGDGVDRVL